MEQEKPGSSLNNYPTQKKSRRCNSSVTSCLKIPSIASEQYRSKLSFKESIVQQECDTISKNLAIMNQNEYILRQFKEKEKEMTKTYEKLMKQQE
jgi:hypothetical protein